jgi:hypothetical protein
MGLRGVAHMTSRNPDRRVPTFFQVGAAKAGTTSLWAMIEQHPAIAAPVGVKEPQYFVWADEEQEYDFRGWERIPRDYQTDWDAYLDLFEVDEATQVLGEASVQYLAHPAAPAKIAARAPEAKILIVLREPVARAWSHYTYNLMRTEESERDFMAALRAELATTRPFQASAYATLGKYSEQVGRWIDQFGRDNVMVLLSSDLRDDLEGSAREVFRFLGLDSDVHLEATNLTNPTQTNHPLTDAIFKLRTSPGPVGRVARTVHARLANSAGYRNVQRAILRGARRVASKTGAGKPQGIPDDASAFLSDYYASDIEELEKLIGRDLSGWKKRSAKGNPA